MFKFLSLIFCISTFFSFGILAVDFYTLGAVGSGSEALLINEHGACHGVSNAGSLVYFIPTKTAAEWSSFRANPPTDVTVNTCCAKVC